MHKKIEINNHPFSKYSETNTVRSVSNVRDLSFDVVLNSVTMQFRIIGIHWMNNNEVALRLIESNPSF